MRLIKTIETDKGRKPIEINALNYSEFCDQNGLVAQKTNSSTLNSRRGSNTFPNLIKRNQSKLEKRQKEFNLLSGGISTKKARQLLTPDEYAVIKLYYGLENELATMTAIACIILNEKGKPSSRQWILQLKQQGLKKLFINKVTNIWGVTIESLGEILTEEEYKVISEYYGLNSKQYYSITPVSIANYLKLPLTKVTALIKSAERKLSSVK